VDIAIDYTGLRPGEKLHEELISSLEVRSPTPHPHIHRIVEGPGAPLRPDLQEIRAFVDCLGQEEPAATLERLWALIGHARPAAQPDPATQPMQTAA
jgi:FlaA1/EpsC-like NDP-sugar epimerase